MEKEYIINRITFEEVLPKWKQLWPGKEKIKPINCNTFLGGTDFDIPKRFKATYFGCYHNKELIGVTSGYRNTLNIYRVRGTWVDEIYRGKGISTLLLKENEKQAKLEKCTIMWTMGRKSAEYAYKNFGFIRVGEYFSEGVEFGPNCYLYKQI
jgi:GNAT superfamily N-acetyltransferase